jgi:hypothetical protein
VAGKRGGDQHLGLFAPVIDREIEQIREGQALHHRFLQVDFDIAEFFPHLVTRLVIGLERAGRQFPCGRQRPHGQGATQRIAFVAGQFLAGIQQVKERARGTPHGFIGLIDQKIVPLPDRPVLPGRRNRNIAAPGFKLTLV